MTGPEPDSEDLGASDRRSRALTLVRRWGQCATSFQIFVSTMHYWVDDDTESCVAYYDTGSGWVAAGTPIGPPAWQRTAAQRFIQAAREHSRRACFFATEGDFGAARPLRRLGIGEQPVWEPNRWPEVLAAHRGLRQQLRRARGKQVRVGRVGAADLAPQSPLRREVDALTARWLASRHMQPMDFLVAVEPFEQAPEHRYYVARRGDEVVAFLALAPIFAKDGWLFEHLLRDPAAPNGTAELLIDAAMRDIAADDAPYATMGLAPLAGHVPGPLRLVRRMARGLYDFLGLRAFKARLHPQRWEPVWLTVGPTANPGLAVIESLRAFAGGSLMRFAWQTFYDVPPATAWLVAMALVPWSLMLAVFIAAGQTQLLGFGRIELGIWTVFDILLCATLWHAARHFRPRLGALLAAACSADALASLLRFGEAVTPATHGLFRGLAAFTWLGPLLGAGALWRAVYVAHRRARSRSTA